MDLTTPTPTHPDALTAEQRSALVDAFPGGPLGQRVIELALRFGMAVELRTNDTGGLAFLSLYGVRAGAVWADGDTIAAAILEPLDGEHGDPVVGLVPVYRHLTTAAGIGDEIGDRAVDPGGGEPRRDGRPAMRRRPDDVLAVP